MKWLLNANLVPDQQDHSTAIAFGRWFLELHKSEFPAKDYLEQISVAKEHILEKWGFNLAVLKKDLIEFLSEKFGILELSYQQPDDVLYARLTEGIADACDAILHDPNTRISRPASKLTDFLLGD